MKKEWLMVIGALSLVMAVSGCCHCKKETVAAGLMPTAQAAEASAPQIPSEQVSPSYSSHHAIK